MKQQISPRVKQLLQEMEAEKSQIKLSMKPLDKAMQKRLLRAAEKLTTLSPVKP